MKVIPETSDPPKELWHREGELYRLVETFDKSFELRYGYYSDIDRHTEPVVIYPDFIKEPVFTAEGEPFVTMMQDACARYSGVTLKNEDTTCSECTHFRRGEEWFGICTNRCNRKIE